MFIMQILAKLVKILHSEGEPRQIALGFAFGAIIGLTPVLALHNLAVLVLIFVFNTSIPAAFFGIFIFSAFAYLLDPVFHSIGFALLTNDGLRAFWTYLYNVPVAPLLRFYNTVVLGSLVSAILLQVPIYFGAKQFVIEYRAHLAVKVEKWKLIQIIKSSKIVNFYKKVKALGVIGQ